MGEIIAVAVIAMIFLQYIGLLKWKATELIM